MIEPQSATELANLALDMMGENRTLLSIESDDTLSGRTLRRAFWQSWDEVLREGRWNCARKRRSIAALSEVPEWGFSTYYQLPADFVNVQEIEGLAEGQQWEIEQTPGGAYAIACDLQEPLRLAYTFRLRDIARADAVFAGAFVAHLAATCSPAITRNEAITKRCWDIYGMKSVKAASADGRDGARRRVPDAEIITARD